MATAAKFVQLILNFLAYLVPFDVDVVPIKFNQFLFGEYPARLQIPNGGRCHGNQGTKNVKFTPNFTNVCSNVSCHLHIYY
jgi:hypothetical protein